MTDKYTPNTQFIQTITIVDSNTLPIDTSNNILEVEGIQIQEPRIKPKPIIVASRPLSAITSIQMNVIEVTVDEQSPNVVTSEPNNNNNNIPLNSLMSGPESRHCSFYISKDCALCIGSATCLAAMVMTGIS